MAADATRSKPGLRERKNLETQRAIVRATAELTLEESFQAATLPRIAERAGIAPRTVSGWFPVKDDILFQRAHEHQEIARRHFESFDGDTLDQLKAWLAEEMEVRPADSDPELEELRFRAIESDPELRARSLEDFGVIHTLIANSVANDTGTSPEETGPQLFAGATIAMLHVLQASSFEDISEQEIETRFKQGFEFLQAGLDTLSNG